MAALVGLLALGLGQWGTTVRLAAPVTEPSRSVGATAPSDLAERVFTERVVAPADVPSSLVRAPSGPALTPLPTTAETVDRGAWLFGLKGCTVCHGANGEGIIGPRIAGTSLALGAVLDQVRRPPHPRMPTFPRDDLSDEGVAQIYAFLQSVRGSQVTPPE